MAAVEATHWWYAATRALLHQLVGPALAPGGRFLDAGGGTGATGAWMGEQGTLVASDALPAALSLYARAHPSLAGAAAADVQALPFPDRSFDAVLCVTVLCHRSIADPAVAVAELARVTRPGGLVVLMEPGVRRLRRAHDRVTHSARRFSVGDLRAAAVAAGLEVSRADGRLQLPRPAGRGEDAPRAGPLDQRPRSPRQRPRRPARRGRGAWSAACCGGSRSRPGCRWSSWPAARRAVRGSPGRPWGRPWVGRQGSWATACTSMPPRGRCVKVTVTALRLRGGHDLAGDLGRQRLGEHGPVPERPQVELQRLALHAVPPGHVLDHDVGQVRLAGDRAHGRQLVGGEPHGRHVVRGRKALDVVDRMADGPAEDRQRRGRLGLRRGRPRSLRAGSRAHAGRSVSAAGVHPPGPCTSAKSSTSVDIHRFDVDSIDTIAEASLLLTGGATPARHPWRVSVALRGRGRAPWHGSTETPIHPFGRLVVGVGGDRLPLEDIRMAQHLYGPSPELIDGGGTELHLVDPRGDRHHHDRLRQLRHAGHADLRGLRRHVPLRSRADRRGPARPDRTPSTPPPGPGRAGSEAAPCRSLIGRGTRPLAGRRAGPERAGSRCADGGGRRPSGRPVGRPFGPAGRPRGMAATPGGPPRDSHSPACRVPCSSAPGPPGSDHLPRRAGARGPCARARARPRRDRHRVGRAVAASARRPGGAQGRRPARRHGLHVPAARCARPTPSGLVEGAAAIVVGARRYESILPPRPDGTGPIRRCRPLRLDGPLRPAEGGSRHRRRPPAGGTGTGRGCWPTTTPSSTERSPTAPGSAGSARTPTCCCPAAGSWFVLGCVVTERAAAGQRGAGRRRCGACRRCLDGCPTAAIVAPGVVDARRCLAWLVQAPGHVPASSTGWRSATASTAATTARRSARRTSERTRPGHGPLGAAGAGRRSGSIEAWVPLLELLEADDDDAAGPPRPLVPRRPRPAVAAPQRAVALGNVGRPADPDVADALASVPRPIETRCSGRTPCGPAGGWAGRICSTPSSARTSRRWPRSSRRSPAPARARPTRRPARWGVKHLLVTNDFPPKIGGIQSLPLGAVAAPAARPASPC